MPNPPLPILWSLEKLLVASLSVLNSYCKDSAVANSFLTEAAGEVGIAWIELAASTSPGTAFSETILKLVL